MSASELHYYSDGLRIAGYLHSSEDWQPGDPLRPGILMLAGCAGNNSEMSNIVYEETAAWFRKYL